METMSLLLAGSLLMQSKEGSFLKVTSSIYLSREESCLDVHTLYLFESKLCIYIILRQVYLTESMYSSKGSQFA